MGRVSRTVLMSIVYLLIVIVMVASLGIVVVRWAEPRMAFHPIPGPTPPVAPYRRFEITTQDSVRVSGWTPMIPDDGPVILYCCGNAGNLSDRTDLLAAAAAAGLTVVAFNYRGTGESSGGPTEEGVYQDAIAVYHHLTDSLNIDPSRIVVWGHSIGGAVATELARRCPVVGLIIESTFRSGRAMARRILPWLPTSLLMSYRFDNEATLPQLDIPVLFIHGTSDPFVPAEDSRFLHGLIPNRSELWLVESASHNDIFEVAGKSFFDRIAAFSARVSGAEGSNSSGSVADHPQAAPGGRADSVSVADHTKTGT